MKDKYTDNLHNYSNDKLYQYGRELRKSLTPAEKLLWKYLRNRGLDGLKFRRQHPLERFIADFYCHEKKLVVELDGSVHDGVMDQEYDKFRTEVLSDAGIIVIRFRNEVVLRNIDFVLNEIRKTVSALSSANHPAP